MTYTFRNNGGTVVTVIASSEENARHEAMCKLWGSPTGIYSPRYRGRGLVLI